jgi:hypothetical protein
MAVLEPLAHLVKALLAVMAGLHQAQIFRLAVVVAHLLSVLPV